MHCCTIFVRKREISYFKNTNRGQTFQNCVDADVVEFLYLSPTEHFSFPVCNLKKKNGLHCVLGEMGSLKQPPRSAFRESHYSRLMLRTPVANPHMVIIYADKKNARHIAFATLAQKTKQKWSADSYSVRIAVHSSQRTVQVVK